MGRRYNNEHFNYTDWQVMDCLTRVRSGEEDGQEVRQELALRLYRSQKFHGNLALRTQKVKEHGVKTDMREVIGKSNKNKIYQVLKREVTEKSNKTKSIQLKTTVEIFLILVEKKLELCLLQIKHCCSCILRIELQSQN